MRVRRQVRWLELRRYLCPVQLCLGLVFEWVADTSIPRLCGLRPVRPRAWYLRMGAPPIERRRWVVVMTR